MFRQLLELIRPPSANGPFVIPRSDRDRLGPLGHRKVAEIKRFRERQHRRFLIALVVACPLGFAAPFAVTFVLDRLNDPLNKRPDPVRAQHPRDAVIEAGERDENTERPSIYSRTPNTRGIQICGWAGTLRRGTCLVDGDTGWENGVKWRLADVDTPEITNPGCSSERQQGLAARDRLQDLMSGGYSIDWLGRTDRYSRQLVNIRLGDGRDAGRVLLGEGLARPFPNSQKAWCSG